MTRDPITTQRVYSAVASEPTPVADIMRNTGLCKTSVNNHLYTLKKQKKVAMQRLEGVARNHGPKCMWRRVE